MFFALAHLRQLAFEASNVFEAFVNACEAYIGNFVEVRKFVHYFVADFARANLTIAASQ